MSSWIKSWPQLIAVLLLVGAGSFLFAWFVRSRPSQPRLEETDMLPLVCDTPIIGIGEIAVPKAEHTYTLRNRSEREARITKIGKTCNCLEPEFDRTVIGPGETAHVGVTIRVNAKNPALLTRFLERLSIHCNDQDDRLELELHGTYVPPLYYEMLQINLLAPENVDEPFDGKYEVFLRRGKDVKIRQVQVLNIACEAAVSSRTPVGQGDYDKAVIAMKGKLSEQPLPQTGTLEIQTTSADVPVLQIPIVLFNPRTDEVKIEPPRLAIGIVSPGSRLCREVAFRLPAGAGYEVEKMESSSPRITVMRKQAEDDGEVKKDALYFLCNIDCTGVTGKIDEKIIFRLKKGARRLNYTVFVSGFVKTLAPSN